MRRSVYVRVWTLLTSLNTENCSYQKKNQVKDDERFNKACEAGMDYGKRIQFCVLIHDFILPEITIYSFCSTLMLQLFVPDGMQYKSVIHCSLHSDYVC